MKFSFVTLGCPDWNLERIAQKAAEYGYDGVELRAKGDKHVDSSLTLEERKNIVKLFKQYNLDISCLAGYSTFSSSKEEDLETNRQLLLDNIALARDLGSPFVRTFIGDPTEGITEEEIIKNAAQHIGFCGSKAFSEGVTVLIESHDAYCNGAKLKKVFDLIAGKGVGVLWDIENNYAQNETIEGFYGALGQKIQHLHVRDAYRQENGKMQICLAGKGTVPLKECMDLLKRVKYDGYVSLEWEKMWHMELEEPEVAFPQFIEYIKSI